MYSTLRPCPMLMKLKYSWHVFEKHPNFVKIRPVVAELLHAERRTDGHTDRHDENNSRFRNV
jgi:hypothetical protein